MTQNNEIISPAFKNYFKKFQKDGSIDQYLELIQDFYGDPKELIFVNFESELNILGEGLQNFNPKVPEQKAVVLLFRTLICLYLDTEPEAISLYSKIDVESLKCADALFYNIYLVLDKYFQANKVNGKVKSSAIIYSRDDSEFWDHLAQFNLENSRRIPLTVSRSKDKLDLEKLFSENEYIFINGHGDDSETGGLKYYIDSNNFIRLPGPLIEYYIKNVEVLGLLSCGVRPYSNYKTLAKYFVLSEYTAMPTFSEMFIKTFFLVNKATKDTELSLKMALVYLYFRSNSDFVFQVYKMGKPINI